MRRPNLFAERAIYFDCNQNEIGWHVGEDDDVQIDGAKEGTMNEASLEYSLILQLSPRESRDFCVAVSTSLSSGSSPRDPAGGAVLASSKTQHLWHKQLTER